MASEVTAWAVVTRYGDILASTLSDKRITTIKLLVGDDRTDWRYWRRNYGYRCARVSVRIMGAEAGNGRG